MKAVMWVYGVEKPIVHENLISGESTDNFYIVWDKNGKTLYNLRYIQRVEEVGEET